MTTEDEFMDQIARVESDHNYTLQTNGAAFGIYQMMPGRWKVWAPKALGTDKKLAVAGRSISPFLWVPEPTPANQETVARWWVRKLLAWEGDWRRVAASWNGGGSVGFRQPGDFYLSDAGTTRYYWPPGVLKYVNNVCHGYMSGFDGVWHETLGFPETTRATILPSLPES